MAVFQSKLWYEAKEAVGHKHCLTSYQKVGRSDRASQSEGQLCVYVGIWFKTKTYPFPLSFPCEGQEEETASLARTSCRV
jgi:hypothetical protein